MQKCKLGQNDRPTLARLVRGVEFYDGFLSDDEQKVMVNSLREVAQVAPMFSPKTRFGKSMSVQLTAAGKFGWYSDRSGYRYVDQHPSGVGWPGIPKCVLDVWQFFVTDAPDPECCLINYYGEGARMGMHQDMDEADYQWPVVSISLGDEALFRIGSVTKGGSTESTWLRSGDVCLMGGDARLVHHGIDRIKFGTSTLLPRGGGAST